MEDLSGPQLVLVAIVIGNGAQWYQMVPNSIAGIVLVIALSIGFWMIAVLSRRPSFVGWIRENPECEPGQVPRHFVLYPEDEKGVWCGIHFTCREAFLTLQFVNEIEEVTDWTLQQDIGLQQRAVDSIREAIYVNSISDLAHLEHVGAGTLAALKDHVMAIRR